MKASTIPILCAICLAAMSAAGASHWWSVSQFVTAFHAGLTIPPVEPPAAKSITPPQVSRPAATLAQTPQPSLPSSEQKIFYEALIKKIDNLENKNKDLDKLMSETNRDVTTLGFRVDTYSNSFRPLPTSEKESDTALEDNPGVLPPRAEPVFPLGDE
jgi:hypothetical protein